MNTLELYTTMGGEIHCGKYVSELELTNVKALFRIGQGYVGTLYHKSNRYQESCGFRPPEASVKLWNTNC